MTWGTGAYFVTPSPWIRESRDLRLFDPLKPFGVNN